MKSGKEGFLTSKSHDQPLIKGMTLKNQQAKTGLDRRDYTNSGIANSENLFDSGLINILKSDRFQFKNENYLHRNARMSKSIYVCTDGSIAEETEGAKYESLTDRSLS
jgi:hypothetical protein